MRTDFWRVFLTPRTSWRAFRVMQSGKSPMTFDAAWVLVRLHDHPDELPYLNHRNDRP
jgi:hypothetical protein